MYEREVHVIVIRKQIYLPADEDRRLKEIARTRGQSEAALIREAIRQRLDDEDERDVAWRRLEKLLEALPIAGEATHRFQRADVYAERLDKYDGTR